MARPPRPKGCNPEELFRFLGKAHLLEILRVLVDHKEPMRFVDIQSQVPVNPNTLSARLKDLVGAGFLDRVAYNEIPPRVTYQATDKARELRTVFRALCEWSGNHDLRCPNSATAAENEQEMVAKTR